MIRVLLDENLPRKLKRHLGEGVTSQTVPERGWAGIGNGELLRLAQSEFDVFLTTDQGIPHQQNLSLLALAVIILEAPSNRLEDLLGLVPEIRRALETVQRELYFV